MRNRCCILLLAVLSLAGQVAGQSREEIVRNDRKKVEAEGFWIYNDLEKGFAEARKTGKPLAVVLRCLPCEECVKLDDELMETDPAIRGLLQNFVCVRQVSTNGLDLSLFQFDTDQSFTVFLLNADQTIYGRYGTRSDRTEWKDDVSLEGLAKALRRALELHRDYDFVKGMLAGKRGKPMEFPTPERYPAHRGKYTDKLNYDGDVVKSCIHCHQIGDAQREYYWHEGRSIPQEVLYPYPHPKSLGMILDPREMATIKTVVPDSPAADAGLKSGDIIQLLDGQPMLSIADVQWVLHQVDPAGGRLLVSVVRDGQTVDLTLELQSGWRTRGDLSWRVSSWGLRRIATGGLLLEPATDEERSELAVAEGEMALQVKHVGQYGPHATAKQAGFQKGDILIEFDSQRDLLREQDVHTYVVTRKKPGDRLSVKVLREGREMSLTLPVQK